MSSPPRRSTRIRSRTRSTCFQYESESDESSPKRAKRKSRRDTSCEPEKVAELRKSTVVPKKVVKPVEVKKPVPEEAVKKPVIAKKEAVKKPVVAEKEAVKKPVILYAALQKSVVKNLGPYPVVKLPTENSKTKVQNWKPKVTAIYKPLTQNSSNVTANSQKVQQPPKSILKGYGQPSTSLQLSKPQQVPTLLIGQKFVNQQVVNKQGIKLPFASSLSAIPEVSPIRKALENESRFLPNAASTPHLFDQPESITMESYQALKQIEKEHQALKVDNQRKRQEIAQNAQLILKLNKQKALKDQENTQLRQQIAFNNQRHSQNNQQIAQLHADYKHHIETIRNGVIEVFNQAQQP